MSYDVKLSGLEPEVLSPLKSTFKSTSLLEAEKSSPLLSVSNLKKHIKSDIALLTRIMRAEGYYDSTVTERLTRKDNHFGVNIIVLPGPLYHLEKVEIAYKPPMPDEEIRALIDTSQPLKTGNPALAQDVIEAEGKIDSILPKLGFPFAQEITQDIIVDHHSKTMDIVFSLDTGIRRRMGELVITGLKSVEKEYIAKLIPWDNTEHKTEKKPVFFDQELLQTLRSRLNKTGLFSGITIDINPGRNDQADINLTLTEAKHRTIGTAAGYSTSEGISGEVSWEHRNFLHKGNRLKLVASGSEIEQSFSSLLEIPNYNRLDQTLSFEASYRRQDTDAYFAHTINTNAGLNRVITGDLAVRIGAELEYSNITDTLTERDFYIAALPLGIRWDSSDSLLDPSRGLRVSLVTAPSIGLDGKKFTFLKSELRASGYYPLIEGKATLALRTRLGSIVGTETETLPATRRFFAGGGGSVRGYAFQRVGPIDLDDVPLGGRSVTEITAEVRWKFMPNISIVPFIEGGNIYDSELPKFSDLRWAAGIGGRYHTGFGPIRLDIAFPLNRREGDSSFQFYVSLGQAF